MYYLGALVQRSLRGRLRGAALGRWIGKRVAKPAELATNGPGDFFYYDGHRVIEHHKGQTDGTTQPHRSFVYGLNYIDEQVAQYDAFGSQDDVLYYVLQDANWNVIALTDLGGSVVERCIYTPYGQLTIHQETSYGDRDGDQDVDAADKGTPGSTCTGTVSGACRILDLDFDGDYDSTDATKFGALDQGLARLPGRVFDRC